LLTIAETAAMLSISRRTLYRLMNSGELLPVRVAGRRRFRPVDIDSFLERNRETVP
jgi:excisionase family DNA binding protein